MSNEKVIDRVRRDEYNHAPVGPSGTELSIQTQDGWDYLFRRLTDSEPFELVHKRRGDGSVSESEVVPKVVVEYFEQTPDIELVNATVIA